MSALSESLKSLIKARSTLQKVTQKVFCGVTRLLKASVASPGLVSPSTGQDGSGSGWNSCRERFKQSGEMVAMAGKASRVQVY